MKRLIALILTMLVLSGSVALAEDTSQYSLSTISRVPDFTTVDQRGNPVDQTVFAQKDYTLLVFWGTWCGPCVAEIPELVAAGEELSAMNVQIVGICEDGESNREGALEILEANGATYVNIMPNDQFYDDFVSLCFAFPSAMLIGSDGSVVQNQFSLKRDAASIIAQIGELLQGSAAAADVVASDSKEEEDPIAAYYDQYKQAMLGYGYLESDTRISNLPFFEELHRKAYAYATDQYFLRTTIEIKGKETGEIRLFVTGGNYRSEEYTNGKVSYVTVYNAQKDEYILYQAESGTIDRISNASLKGYRSTANLYASMDLFSNNAVLGNLSDTEYQGNAAILSTYEAHGFMNKVWMDKKTGIVLRFEQRENDREYSETYALTPDVAFDDSIFEFDASVLSVDTKGL